MKSTIRSQRTAAEALSTLAPNQMSRIGTVNEQFQSFNVEMIVVTGGTILDTI